LADILFISALVIMCAGLLLGLIRLLKGPTVADRTVAVDVMTIISVSIMCVAAFLFDRIVYIDTALMYGLISFIGVITVARYLERGL
jgi:multicomponent Na+:H+ antiporter subunit F